MTIMEVRSAAELLDEVESLRAAVLMKAEAIARHWEGWVERPDFAPSVENFAHYLALRGRDIRPLQLELTARGLSSLGRAESRVLPTLDAVAGVLAVLAGKATSAPEPDRAFFVGEERLVSRTAQLLGPSSKRRPVHFLITAPSEAAEGDGFMLRLAELGVEAVRINCAHDDQDAWARMIQGLDSAAKKTGRRMKVLMDLAGPKIRTGAIRVTSGPKRIAVGDEFAITAPGELGAAGDRLAAIECTLREPLAAARPRERIFIDDGKVAAEVKRTEEWGVLAEVKTCPKEKGYRLKPEKGINFPDTAFAVAALTDKDVEDLAFVARHADGIEYSFVQCAEDVAALQDALAEKRPDDWRKLGLVLKIETNRAVTHLPDMLVRAAGRQPTAIMIARGDLAVEIGFARLAEMQEEILWLGEAAQIPVIWATEVLEHFIKKGVPSRGEMTDAAMSARAECVMLNKGPFLFEAIAQLDLLLGRMSEHLHKKTPQLRRLASW
jgi:pyruvate kinase